MGLNKTQRQDLLSRWIKPSSDDEKAQQDRAERMVKDAIGACTALKGVSLAVYTKGSYPNNTNIRRDSDVDVVVEMHECQYFDFKAGLGAPPPRTTPSYSGIWTPQHWRKTVRSALIDCFGASQIDTSGKIAINIAAVPGSRPSADVVPSFDYVRYNDLNRQTSDSGSCVFPSDGAAKVVNWPDQQLSNGRKKNTNSGGRYKSYVRALKNAENVLAAAGTIKDLPSYLMECLVFNIDNATLQTGGLDDGFRATLVSLWKQLDGDGRNSMVEPNWMKWLFKGHQKWTVADAKSLVLATWQHLDYDS